MGVTITADRIRLTDSSGVVKFDTSEGLFTCTNFVSGSYARGSVTASATSFGRTNVDQTNTLTIATGLHTSANIVLGLVRTNWSGSSSGVNFNQMTTGWRNANATMVDMISFHTSHHGHNTAGGINNGGAIADALWLQGLSFYTFRVASGTLYMDERIVLQAYVHSSGSTTYSITRGAGNVDYRLYVGAFV